MVDLSVATVQRIYDGPLSLDVADDVARLTLNRPEGNALSPELLATFEATWPAIEADAAIRVAIITGAGKRHFCTGASVNSLTPTRMRGDSVSRSSAVRTRSHGWR